MTTTPTSNLARDPVCGMNVNPDTAKYVHEHAGKNYYFCCAGCLKKFESDPAGYLNKLASSGLVTLGMPSAKPSAHAHAVSIHPAPKPAAQPKVVYVCPMCPEVRESKPGACPSCGMALEPETPIATRTEYTCPMHP